MKSRVKRKRITKPIIQRKPKTYKQKGGNSLNTKEEHDAYFGKNFNPFEPIHLTPDVIAIQRRQMNSYKPKWYEKGIVGEIKSNKLLSQIVKLFNNRAGRWVEQKGWGKKSKHT